MKIFKIVWNETNIIILTNFLYKSNRFVKNITDFTMFFENYILWNNNLWYMNKKVLNKIFKVKSVTQYKTLIMITYIKEG